jgi:putative two-component system response regulator
MVVEDNRDLREALREILSFSDYAVITASNGVEALERIRVVTPDLILSDIGMPQMDGFSFLQSVRAHPQWMAIPFVFLTARGEKEDVLHGVDLGVEDYLIKPLTQEELLTAVSARLGRSQQIRMATLRQAYETSLTVLANAIDVREVYIQGHVERVIQYAMILAAELDLQGRLLDQLRLGAILHDIGKIIIQEGTLFKPEQLTEKEWIEIKRHAPAGGEMIRDIEYLAPIIPIIRHHHERWDGQGYPDGLAGEQIPLAARIIAVADSFDTMTVRKPYRDAFSFEGALEEIVRNAGVRYDPEVVSAFQRATSTGKIQPVLEKWKLTKGD